MAAKRIVIAGTGSGVGKTTITIGLMAALRKRNWQVQGFKCGPDYIDPTYHTAVTGRPSRNLDSWMFGKDLLKEIYLRASKDADISVIEGVMGFFDGHSPESDVGSTAEISTLLNCPVILVVDCGSMARSAAAVVKGFQAFTEKANIVGVIANRVGGEGHFHLVKTAIEKECQIPVIGYVNSEIDISLPERHLGLIPSIERGDLNSFFEKLGEIVAKTIDLNLLTQLAEVPAITKTDSSIFDIKREKKVKIAVAKDAAFHFYYQENLDLLEAFGAKLSFFSPLNGETVPDNVNGLYIGGGFPEQFAKNLSEQTAVKQSVKMAIADGIPTLAECGGFMFLTEAIETHDGNRFEMVGAIPGKTVMQNRLAAIGYREIKGMNGNPILTDGLTARGHEFHYAVYIPSRDVPYAYETESTYGKKHEGYQSRNLVAGFTHIHFATCPKIVENFVALCRTWR